MYEVLPKHAEATKAALMDDGRDGPEPDQVKFKDSKRAPNTCECVSAGIADFKRDACISRDTLGDQSLLLGGVGGNQGRQRLVVPTTTFFWRLLFLPVPLTLALSVGAETLTSNISLPTNHAQVH